MNVIITNFSSGPGYSALGRIFARDFANLRATDAELTVRCHTELPNPSRMPIQWQKFSIVLAELSDLESSDDWVIWIDSDVVLLNDKIALGEYFPENKDIVFSIDAFGICTGVFAARNSPWARQFLSTLLFLAQIDPSRQHEFDGRDTWEQNSVKAILRYFPEARKRSGIFPESVVQNRLSDFSQSAFLFHFWMAGRSSREIMRKRKTIKTNGWTKETFRNVCRFSGQRYSDVERLALSLNLTSSQMFAHLGLPKRRSSERQTRISARQSELLVKTADIYNITLQKIPGRRSALLWLMSPNTNLEQISPFEFVRTRNGFSRIRHLLDQILDDELRDLSK
jgi:uncharacterized protein (DUF2384 family)